MVSNRGGVAARPVTATRTESEFKAGVSILQPDIGLAGGIASYGVVG